MATTPIARRFGSNLKRRRLQQAMSQEEVAFRASLHRTEIGLLERGERTPRIDTVARLAGAVEAEFGELMDGIEWVPVTASAGQFSVEPRAAVLGA